MSFLSSYGLFALETLTLVVAVLLFVAGLMSIVAKPKPQIKVISLNDAFSENQRFMQKKIFSKKKIKKQKAMDDAQQPNAFVIDFVGDLKASEVESLRTVITSILSIATEKDEVIVRLESPGGAVNSYGLAASQLKRIRDRGVSLTVCVDKIAASGGYLMASVADKIIASPYAIIGSIGVVAQIPNFHRLLQKNNIDVEMLTAGEFKRTLTLFCENSKSAREKVQEEIEVIHDRFKEHILSNRKHVNIDQISTGEHWLAMDALQLNLVDAIQTSDDYLMGKMQTHKNFLIESKGKTKLADRLLKPVFKLMHPWA